MREGNETPGRAPADDPLATEKWWRTEATTVLAFEIDNQEKHGGVAGASPWVTIVAFAAMMWTLLAQSDLSNQRLFPIAIVSLTLLILTDLFGWIAKLTESAKPLNREARFARLRQFHAPLRPTLMAVVIRNVILIGLLLFYRVSIPWWILFPSIAYLFLLAAFAAWTFFALNKDLIARVDKRGFDVFAPNHRKWVYLALAMQAYTVSAGSLFALLRLDINQNEMQTAVLVVGSVALLQIMLHQATSRQLTWNLIELHRDVTFGFLDGRLALRHAERLLRGMTTPHLLIAERGTLEVHDHDRAAALCRLEAIADDAERRWGASVSIPETDRVMFNNSFQASISALGEYANIALKWRTASEQYQVDMVAAKLQGGDASVIEQELANLGAVDLQYEARASSVRARLNAIWSKTQVS